MRIYYLADSIIPSRSANSIHVMRMCEAFVCNGCQVTLIVPDHKNGVEENIGDVFAFYGVKSNFDIRYFPLLPVPGARYIYSLWLVLWLKFKKFDLVYSRDFYSAVFAALFHVPVVMEFHRPPIHKGRLIGRLIKKFYKSNYLSHIVVISDALKKIFIKDGFLSERLVVAHDGSEEFALEEFLTGNTNLKVGYVGHLYEGRGIELIVHLARVLPMLTFEIVGGNEAAITEWREKTEGIANLHFLGFFPPAEVRTFRSHCDILLAPYQKEVRVWGGPLNTADYMSPLKIFEYMASGRAIVASDLPVLREVLSPENAILCDPSDTGAWTTALVRLANDHNLRARLGQQAREDFERHYSWSKRAAVILGILTNHSKR